MPRPLPCGHAPLWISTTHGWWDRRVHLVHRHLHRAGADCDLDLAAPFSGRTAMVTMDAPAAEMPDSSPCSAPVLSSSVATTVMDSRPVSASNTVILIFIEGTA